MTKTTQEVLVDNLLNEAYEILSKSENLNNDREKLTQIFKQLAIWKGDGSEGEQYFEAYQRVILAMAVLDFTQKLPISDEVKSIQNLFSYTLNTLNEELEDKVFPKALVYGMLKELELKDTVVIGTDINNRIKFFHTDRESLFPAFESFCNQNINIFFEDIESINNRIRKEIIEKGIEVKMKFGYSGNVTLKIVNPSYLKASEGSLYIVKF